LERGFVGGRFVDMHSFVWEIRKNEGKVSDVFPNPSKPSLGPFSESPKNEGFRGKYDSHLQVCPQYNFKIPILPSTLI